MENIPVNIAIKFQISFFGMISFPVANTFYHVTIANIDQTIQNRYQIIIDLCLLLTFSWEMKILVCIFLLKHTNLQQERCIN